MLRLIPRHPKKIDTNSLKAGLEKQGYNIDLRSIQRDLNKLSSSLPLLADNAKPQGWSWQADALGLDIPALDPQTALTFHLVQSHLTHLLPSSTLAYLQPWLSAANNVLDQHHNNLSNWPNKIRVLPRGLQQQAPSISAEVHQAVYQAVLDERQLTITYRNNINQTETPTYIINPLALVVRDKIIYLVCIYQGYQDPRQLALHRITSATVMPEKAMRPQDFSIDDYIATGAFGLTINAQTIQLEAKFAKHVAIHLQESPIADDQVLEYVDEDNVLLKATVADTLELRLWLKSFGDEVMVTSPAELVSEFRGMAITLHNYYQT